MISSAHEKAFYMKKRTQRAITGAALIITVALLALFIKDILIPLFRLELTHDTEGARELLVSKGIPGLAAVSIVEALQMVVVFIPAEFIQISAALSYPFYITVPVCDFGVFLGATVIFILVRTFRYDNAQYEKNMEKISQIRRKMSKDKSTVFLMFILFMMPVVPFGAIAYYGASSKLSYKKYITTMSLGALPDILTSNVMGAATRIFIVNSLPIPLLILIIIVLAVLLFIAVAVFMDKVYFKENDGTPDSEMHYLLFRLADMARGRRQRLTFDRAKLEGLEAPFIVFANHESFWDFYYIRRLLEDYNPSIVANRYILSRPVIKKLLKKAGMIPKKLFSPDKGTAMGLLKTIRGGFPVILFPEGRLSADGRAYPIVEKGGAMYKRLKVSLVFTRISGAYYSRPKWRGTFFKSDIHVSVERVVTAEEAAALPAEDIDLMIEKYTRYEADLETKTVYRQKNKARHLESLLYRCPDCGSLYTTASKGNDFYCTACGARHTLGEDYLFDGGENSIAGFYDRIREMEERELDETVLSSDVSIKVFREGGRLIKKEKGKCTLNRDTFTYASASESFSIATADIPALAFSCGTEFELYHDGDLYYFYPERDRMQAARWALLIDIMNGER